MGRMPAVLVGTICLLSGDRATPGWRRRVNGTRPAQAMQVNYSRFATTAEHLRDRIERQLEFTQRQHLLESLEVGPGVHPVPGCGAVGRLDEPELVVVVKGVSGRPRDAISEVLPCGERTP